MTTVCSMEFLDEYELIEKNFYETKNPHAKFERDSEAREFRKQGWAVRSKKFSFPDFGGGCVYTLQARRKKDGGAIVDSVDKDEPESWTLIRV